MAEALHPGSFGSGIEESESLTYVDEQRKFEHK